MKSFLGKAGDKARARLLRGNALIALDFDGTLAPIVQVSGKARAPAESIRLLRELQKHIPIAIISGRSRADLNSRLGFRPKYLIGNHGIEAPGAGPRVRAAARLARGWRAQLEARWGSLSQDSTIHIEDKLYSLSLHYRGANDLRRTRANLARLAASLIPAPRVMGGKCVFNLMPEGGPDKGSALLDLADRSGAKSILFMGDDVTDEDAFRVRDPRLIHVRVGLRRGSAAQFYVPGQSSVQTVLARLLDSLRLTP